MQHDLKPRALADLAELYADGFERYGVEQADEYLAGLTDAFRFLDRFPRAMRLRSEVNPPVRVHRYRSHMIVYDLGSSDQVLVLRIAHGRSDWANNPA